MSELLKKIKSADAVRVRRAKININGETIPVNIRLHTISDFFRMQSEYAAGEDEANASLLAEQFLDPETGEKIFSPDDFNELTGATVAELLRKFRAANTGELDAKKN